MGHSCCLFWRLLSQQCCPAWQACLTLAVSATPFEMQHSFQASTLCKVEVATPSGCSDNATSKFRPLKSQQALGGRSRLLTQRLVHGESHLAAAQDGNCWPLYCQRGAARVHKGGACPVKGLLPAEEASCMWSEASTEAALRGQ